jgi:PAS domain-containing protein
MDQHPTERARALERELEATRAREVAYREWLAETSARTQRLRKYTAALLDTLGKQPPQQRDLMRTLTDTARISSEALGVARTSLWLFDAAGSQLQCKLILAKDKSEPTLEVALPVSASPAYFDAISTNGVVAVENVHDDPRATGLEAYLAKHGVTALLDISIAIPGELLGVVCHEHTGGPRTWQPEEIDFGTHVSNLFALALEVERRQLAEAKALSAEARYRYLVESLPVTVYSFDAFSQRVDYLSPQIRELGGFSADEWLARGISAWIDAVHEEDRPRVLADAYVRGVIAAVIGTGSARLVEEGVVAAGIGNDLVVRQRCDRSQLSVVELQRVVARVGVLTFHAQPRALRHRAGHDRDPVARALVRERAVAAGTRRIVDQRPVAAAGEHAREDRIGRIGIGRYFIRIVDLDLARRAGVLQKRQCRERSRGQHPASESG